MEELGEVVVVSGSYGAGHDVAADELTRRLLLEGRTVRRLDVAQELLLGVGGLLRWLYFVQLRRLPGTWGTTLRWLEGDGLLLRGVRRALALLGRRLVRSTEGAALVISTHPFASQALGAARLDGRLQCMVLTYLTDASVHPLWVHPGVDLHLAWHDVAAQQTRARGGAVTVVDPLVPAATALRPGIPLPWPAGLPVALVVGGSCGIGELEETALDVLATGGVLPVVACGRNEALLTRLATRPGIVALGWRDDLASLAAEADLVIQNAGGMTSLEALAAGTPTLTYRPIPGHGITNALALEDAGLVPWARDADELAAALAGIVLARAPREAVVA